MLDGRPSLAQAQRHAHRCPGTHLSRHQGQGLKLDQGSQGQPCWGVWRARPVGLRAVSQFQVLTTAVLPLPGVSFPCSPTLSAAGCLQPSNLLFQGHLQISSCLLRVYQSNSKALTLASWWDADSEPENPKGGWAQLLIHLKL